MKGRLHCNVHGDCEIIYECCVISSTSSNIYWLWDDLQYKWKISFNINFRNWEWLSQHSAEKSFGDTSLYYRNKLCDQLVICLVAMEWVGGNMCIIYLLSTT